VQPVSNPRIVFRLQTNSDLKIGHFGDLVRTIPEIPANSARTNFGKSDTLKSPPRHAWQIAEKELAVRCEFNKDGFPAITERGTAQFALSSQLKKRENWVLHATKRAHQSMSHRPLIDWIRSRRLHYLDQRADHYAA
jgi:hypothetical protein